MKKIFLLIGTALTWQVAAQQLKPQSVPVSCVGCDVLPPAGLTLSCKNGKVQVDHANVKQSTNWKITWALDPAISQITAFTITFPATGNPCVGGSTFDQNNSTCTLSPTPLPQYPASYTYTVHMNGCSDGTGTIQYLKPSTKLAAKKQKASKTS
jgi:hypothetical protein